MRAGDDSRPFFCSQTGRGIAGASIAPFRHTRTVPFMDFDNFPSLPSSTPSPEAARLLGAVVELSTPVTGQAPIVWSGYVCSVAESVANVTEAAPAPMYSVVRVDELLQLRVVTAPDPQIAACADCQEDSFLGRMMCDTHRPAGLPD